MRVAAEMKAAQHSTVESPTFGRFSGEEGIPKRAAGLHQGGGLPIRVMMGRDDRLFPAGFLGRVAEDRLDITPDLVPGGHLAALSQFHAVAARLLGFLHDT
jgi:hypothetical protein